MARVRTGLEILASEGARAAGLAPGARIGVLAHAASVDAGLRHAVDLLATHREFEVARLFAPEHGVRGEAQDMEAVDERRDPVSGLPVCSLYGSDATSLRPRAEDLDGLAAVVVDLQDVGARYYTFATTVVLLLESAATAGVPVVVLDRPNPLGGTGIEGPVLRPELQSFVGRGPVPVRHGLTIAELVRLVADHESIAADLRTVAMRGWRRAMRFDDTGLPWVPPSPNMPTTDTARVYPGGCLVEGTNLSEGRGTTRPFEWIGAPWLDAPRLAADLNGRGMSGVRFGESRFRPMFQKHAGEGCAGVFVQVTDRDRFRPFRTYLEILASCRRQEPGAFAWRREAYEFVTDRLAIDLLLGREDLRPALEAGEPPEEMERRWAGDLEVFRSLREGYLLYD